MASAGPPQGSGMPGSTPIPINQQRSPAIMKLANYLRGHSALKMRTGLLNNKEEIDFFRFKRLHRLLMGPEYKQKSADPKNELVPIPGEQELTKIFVMLIQARLLIPVEKLHFDQIKAVKGWKPNRQKPTLRPTTEAKMDEDVYYAWTYQKPNPYMLLYGFLMLAGIFTVILFPLWPRFMRVGVWYLSVGCLGLLGLFFAMAIVRLIIFIVTYLALPQAFWLYPNLFEDCGFFESFQPLYAWSEPDKKKKKKSKSRAKIEELPDDSTEAAEPSAASSGVQQNATTVKKRGVTLEEVAED